jgi:hypothetical protein
MKNLLNVLAILFLAVCGFSVSSAATVKSGAAVKVKASGRAYRVHGVLQQGARLVRASAVTSGGRAEPAAGSAAGTASGNATEPVTVAMDAAEAEDASEGYDAAALSTEHHVRCLIVVEQADAAIYVDGMRAGTSPVEVDWDGRATEKHTVRVIKDGMASFEQTFSQGLGDAAIYVRLEEDVRQ